MGEMKNQDIDIDNLTFERDFWKAKAEALTKGLQEIVQMERYPRESGSHVYDGIYPTGRFAVKVLKGEWKDAGGIESYKK
jgi:hypothetical protein